jgi:hypothetical protein
MSVEPCRIRVYNGPNMSQSIAGKLGSHQEVSGLISSHGLPSPNGRLEQLLKLGLIGSSYKRQPDVWDLGPSGRRCCRNRLR